MSKDRLSPLEEDLLTLLGGRELSDVEIHAAMRMAGRGGTAHDVRPLRLRLTFCKLKWKGLVIAWWGTGKNNGVPMLCYRMTDRGREVLRARQRYRQRLRQWRKPK